MATFTTANVTALTDRLGATWAQLVAMGAATEATNARTGAATLKTDLEALSIEKGLVLGSGVVALIAALDDVEGLTASSFTTGLRALNSDLGGFSAYALANSIMYSSDFRDLCAAAGITIAATYVYKMSPQTLLTFAVTGATTGTPVTTGALDTSLYGPVQCEILITSDISSATTVNLTMVKADATTQVKTVNLTTADDTGEAVAIGLSTDVYVDCSGVTISGGTNGDAFTVRTKALRAPSVS
jgi:hypothetical protein